MRVRTHPYRMSKMEPRYKSATQSGFLIELLNSMTLIKATQTLNCLSDAYIFHKLAINFSTTGWIYAFTRDTSRP